MSTLLAAVVAAPPGPLSLLTHDATLVAAGFTDDPRQLRARLSAARRTLPLRPVDDLGDVSKRMLAYLDGDLAAVDGLAVEQEGTAFQRRVWSALRDVPAGTTVTYAELAGRAGGAAAVRAAGSACGRNLIAPVVPCHRVVRTDGGLGGYAYGLPCKRWLLEHERRHAAPAP